MQNQLPSLITADPQAGLALAARLAEQLQAQIDEANAKVEKPGGMNYLMPPGLSKEATTSILFYAITAANGGWSAEAGGERVA